jgi:transcription initiation factor TFIID subunit 11
MDSRSDSELSGDDEKSDQYSERSNDESEEEEEPRSKKTRTATPAEEEEDDLGFLLPSCMPSKSSIEKRVSKHESTQEREEDFERDFAREEEEEETSQRIDYQFSPKQEQRFTAFKTSRFPHNAVKDAMKQVSPSLKISKEMQIVMAGMTKLYVGELVETARLVMKEWGDTGPIQPKHLREAYRRLRTHSKAHLNLKRL